MSAQQLVRNWMTTDVISVDPKVSIVEAHEMMRTYGVRRLPVVLRGRLLGIITKGDVRGAKPSQATSLDIWEINYLLARLRVERVMTTALITIAPDADVVEAAELMLNHKISGLPVLDENQQLVGIITETDIFRMLVMQRLQERNEVAIA
ncbi:MAG: CBS domain-containing protein [Phototrophicaceae bacterium]|jgi:CBS domain-containing protein